MTKSVSLRKNNISDHILSELQQIKNHAEGRDSPINLGEVVHLFYQKNQLVGFFSYTMVEGKNINRIFFDAIIYDIVLSPLHSSRAPFLFASFRSILKNNSIRRFATHLIKNTWQSNLNILSKLSYCSFLQETNTTILCLSGIDRKLPGELDELKLLRDEIFLSCHQIPLNNINSLLESFFQIYQSTPSIFLPIIDADVLKEWSNDKENWIVNPYLWFPNDTTPLL